MGAYVLRRLLQSVIVVVGVTLVSFLALQAGGDPTYLFVSERASLVRSRRPGGRWASTGRCTSNT